MIEQLNYKCADCLLKTKPPPESIEPKEAPGEVVIEDPETRDTPETSPGTEPSDQPTTCRQTGPSKRTDMKRYNLRSRPDDRTDHSSSG